MPPACLEIAFSSRSGAKAGCSDPPFERRTDRLPRSFCSASSAGRSRELNGAVHVSAAISFLRLTRSFSSVAIVVACFLRSCSRPEKAVTAQGMTNRSQGPGIVPDIRNRQPEIGATQTFAPAKRPDLAFSGCLPSHSRVGARQRRVDAGDRSSFPDRQSFPSIGLSSQQYGPTRRSA